MKGRGDTYIFVAFEESKQAELPHDPVGVDLVVKDSLDLLDGDLFSLIVDDLQSLVNNRCGSIAN